MNPQTPDNEVARKALDACRDYRKALSEKTNEVARLKAGLDVMSKLYEEERADRIKATNEVARLRELLSRAIEMLTAITCGDEGRDYDWQRVMKDLEKIKKETRIAPSPEYRLNV